MVGRRSGDKGGLIMKKEIRLSSLEENCGEERREKARLGAR